MFILLDWPRVACFLCQHPLFILLQDKPFYFSPLIQVGVGPPQIIFRVGLVLLKQALGSPEKVRGCQGQYETIERLRSLSPKVMQEAFLVQEVRPPLPLTPGGRGRLRALVGACGLVLSSPGRCGETSSFCLNKERGTERPRST